MDYVQLRSGVFYYRRRLPRDVGRLLKQSELVRSLGAGDRDLALRKARSLDRSIDQAIARIKGTPPLHPRRARLLFQTWVDHEDTSEVAGTPINKVTATMPGTVSSIDLAQVIARLAQLMGGEPSSLLSPPTGPPTNPSPSAQGTALSLSKAVDMFLVEHGPSISPKTLVEYDQTFRLAQECWGAELPITSISKATARDLKGLLIRLPANMAQRFPGKSIQDAVALAAKKKVPAITAKTINKKLSNLSAFFRWLKDQGYIEDNPFTGLSVREVAHRRRRDPFTPEQLSAIFSGEYYDGHKSRHEGASWRDLENYWIPLIALFSGMRLGEIAQLSRHDIRQVQDIWVFDIHDRGSNHLKTVASNRLVPIHQELIEMGLLDYRRDVEHKGHEKLFPDLDKAPDGYESSAFSKRFAAYLYRCGVKTDRRLTFHSFRHTFKDMMREAGIDRSVQDALCGHDDGSVQAGYGRGYSVTALSRAMASIACPAKLPHR